MPVAPKPGLFLFGLPGQAAGPIGDARFADRLDIADQYALTPGLLAGRRALITTMHQDQRWLRRHADVLLSFLEGGGTVIAQGQVAVPWLPMLPPYVPLDRPRLAMLEVKRVLDHPVFAGIDPSALNMRKGVRGFYGRGHNPPPAGATIIQVLGAGLPLDWQIAVGAGTLFMHSGNDLWTNMADPAANLQLADQLLDWSIGLQPAQAPHGQ